METNSVRCLTNSLSRFIHLMSCQTWKSMPTQYLKSMAALLKHLKPLLDDIDDEKIDSYSNLWKACENLDKSVNAAGDFIERWSPKRSKILSVLQTEQLLTKIRSSSLEICGILCRLLRTSSGSSGLAGVQHCVQELQSWDTERISKHIEQALKSKNEELVSCNEHLAEIVGSLGLVSNEELLTESIAVEKERMKVESSKSNEEMDQINQIVDLLDLIRQYTLKSGLSGSMNGVTIPVYFRCPLSLDFMSDPVIVASGTTFERSSIQKWLENGLKVCPKTRQYLSHINLIPNYTVKALIANWLDDNNLKSPDGSEIDKVNQEETSQTDNFSSQDIIRTDSFRCSVHSSDSMSRSSLEAVDVGGPSLSEEVSSSTCRSIEHSYTHSRSHSAASVLSSSDIISEGTLLSTSKVGKGSLDDYSRAISLRSADSGYDETTTSVHVDELVQNLKSPSNALQNAAALELRLLAKHNMENRVIIGKCGAVGPLVSLLRSDAKVTQEHAVTALLNLSLNEENKAMIALTGVIEPLVHVLKSGSDAAKENSAATLFSLSLLEDYKSKIGRSGAVRALVNLLGRGTSRGRKDAATALFNLSICHDNKAPIVKAGAVKYLVQLLDPSKGMVDKSVALLANLSTIPEGRLAIAREKGIPLLVEIVDVGSQRGKENAASVLLQLCLNSSKFCTLVLEEGAVPPLVALSQSGTPRAKEKAQQLLSHFRNQREGTSKKRS
ncbi:U-box domain-containing protein 3 isoform X2 [Silene latifolia]|uniref:U-box domain-containing protein 3 isoform X2 n=1 Tax=Silene latifolia TaxID=37657 RepID=UPI003D785EB9